MADSIDRAAPTVDAIPAEKVAEMLFYAMGDPCPCNYTPTDEWLPEICELQDVCPNPDGLLDCWMQFVKHFGERKDDKEL